MAGKTIAQKMSIKPGEALWVSHPERTDLIGPLPADTQIVGAPEDAGTAIVFADDADSLRALVVTHAELLAHPATLWVAYPKGNRTDLNRDSLWPLLTDAGVRPNGQVSIDEVWSALRFRANRPGEPAFTGGSKR
jgi:hypothetical protein